MICWDAVVAAFFCGGGFFSGINRQQSLCEYKSARRPEFTSKIFGNLCSCKTIIFPSVRSNFSNGDIRINSTAYFVELLNVYFRFP